MFLISYNCNGNYVMYFNLGNVALKHLEKNVFVILNILTRLITSTKTN